MNLELMVLCDAATDSMGKLNILGAFDSIYSNEETIQYPHCAVALRIRFKKIEDGEHKIKINIVDEDGKLVVPSMEASANISFPPNAESVAVNMVINIQGIKFEKFGRYSIDLAIDGRQESSLPLYIRKAEGKIPFKTPDTD